MLKRQSNVAKGSGQCSHLQSEVSIEIANKLKPLQASNQEEIKEWFQTSKNLTNIQSP